MTLTRAALAETLAEKMGFSKAESKKVVEFFFEEIHEALENGETVKLHGFGIFELRQKPERPGRNPRTLEEVPIKARRIVAFRPSHKLKALVHDAGRKGSNGDSSG